MLQCTCVGVCGNVFQMHSFDVEIEYSESARGFGLAPDAQQQKDEMLYHPLYCFCAIDTSQLCMHFPCHMLKKSVFEFIDRKTLNQCEYKRERERKIKDMKKI